MSKCIIICLFTILISASPLTVDFSNSTQKFASNLYNILNTKHGNIFFSPISAHAALSMAYQGATGPTATEMKIILNLPEANITAQKYRGVMTSLDATKDVELYIANNIFIQDGYTLNPNFLFQMKNCFMADIQNTDFKKAIHAARQINSWVESKTRSKIKNIVSENDIDIDTRLILINAVYFKGLWLHSFDKLNTKSQKFYVSNTVTVDCQMMHIKSKYLYDENHDLDAQVLNMPYVNKRTSLILMLPNSKSGIEHLEKKLIDLDLYGILGALEEKEVKVSLPKFKIDMAMDLTDPLKKMGLADIFGDKAEFSKMLDSHEPLKVSKVVQKAYIEVNEQGSEAAAATGIEISFRAMMPSKPQLEMILDHPFIIILTYKRIGKVFPIFMGKIVRPN